MAPALGYAGDRNVVYSLGCVGHGVSLTQELDLDSPLVAGELAEAAGQGAGVEGSDGSHGTSVEDDPW